MKAFGNAIKIALFLLAAALVFMGTTAFAAADSLDFWVTLPSISTAYEDGLGEIRLWARGSARYLFLPSIANPDDLRVHTTLPEGLTLGGVSLQSGDATGILQPGTSVELTLGKRTYTVQIMQSSKLPTMWIATQNQSLDKIHASQNRREPADMLLLDTEGETVYRGELTEIKGRGNATFYFPKKPYQIKLRDGTNLLGMGKAKTWILLAEYNDYSLMRNKITFDLAEHAGMDFVSQANWIDLYIDGDYKGTYLLSEKVHINEDRIDIVDMEAETEELNPEPLDTYKRKGPTSAAKGGTARGFLLPENPRDISGGYLLELELPARYPGDPSGFVTKAGQPVVIKSPEYASMEQVEYIRKFMQGYENAIRAKDGIDPETGKHFSEWVDLDSLVNKYLIEEIAKNVDANKTSQFYYKPADTESTVAFAGPVWDYDGAYGNFARSYNPRFASPQYLSAGIDEAESYYWWPKLYRHEAFYEPMTRIYHEVFAPALRKITGVEENPDIFLSTLDEYEALLTDSAAMNRIRWPHFKRSTHSVDTGISLAENVVFLRNFLVRRTEFLDTTWAVE